MHEQVCVVYTHLYMKINLCKTVQNHLMSLASELPEVFWEARTLALSRLSYFPALLQLHLIIHSNLTVCGEVLHHLVEATYGIKF